MPHIASLLTLSLFACCAAVPASAQNLLQNPDAEQPLVGGGIPGWAEVAGTNWTYRSGNPAPRSGENYFFAGAGPNAELRQDVDVSAHAADIDAGTQQYTFSGYLRVFPQSPADEARVVVEYVDGSGQVLDSYDSGAVTNSGDWVPVTDTRTAPVTTRVLRVRLISTRNAGTNNDGYFDDLSLMQATPLPVALASFEAVADGGAVVLRWATASERENAGFEVQMRALHGEAPEASWQVLGFVAGYGTTTEPQVYGFTTRPLAPGRYRFRLRQLDRDGTSAFSDELVRRVRVDGRYTLSEAAPNPFNPQTQFTLSLEREQVVRIGVYDLLGRRVAHLHEGLLRAGVPHRFTFDAPALPSGTYLIRLDGETFATVRQVLLLK